MICVYYMTGAPEGSPKVVLCGYMEKPGIEPATPGFTRHSTCPLHHGGLMGQKKKNFLWLSLGRNQYRREGL